MPAIARPQELGQVGEVPVADRIGARFPTEHQQSRLIAGGRRSGGDELARELVVIGRGAEELRRRFGASSHFRNQLRQRYNPPLTSKLTKIEDVIGK